MLTAAAVSAAARFLATVCASLSRLEGPAAGCSLDYASMVHCEQSLPGAQQACMISTLSDLACGSLKESLISAGPG